MNTKVTTALLILVCISHVTVKGSPVLGKGRCICKGSGYNFIRPKNIEKLEVHPKNTFCDKVEIIATLSTNGDEVCLNPASEAVKHLLNKIIGKASSAKHGIQS
ncbi:C-X-C motif chemokine 11-1-like [Protopterus annectens]|uniref:C-X-C motif chemokine 11-1-like n=1 Tax=Protopterus annectens TaxID=7888 RepID=UPI001CFAB394|nr:C-X-C motif chemokine 11-1-like [Protopterus annectens]